RTRRPVRDRRVAAAEDRVAAVGRARIVVVAVERRPGGAGAALAGLHPVADGAVGGRRPGRPGGGLGPVHGIARGDRAGVVVVAVERRPGGADAALARLAAVADGPVGARRAVRGVRVLAAVHRIAGVDGARVAVVAVGARPGGADAVETCLGAVADGPVRARRAVRHRRVQAARDGVAAVGRAGVAVVAVGRRARS